MTFRLVVNFRGMCTFVPRSDGGRAWVFMQNLREFRHPGVKLDPHRAFIKIDTENVRCDLPRDTSLLWPLSRSDVNFLPGGEMPAGPLRIAGFPQAGEPDLTQPDAVNANSFSWLAPLEIASRRAGNPPGAGVLRPELIDDDVNRIPSSLVERLAARVHLRTGRLETTQRAAIEEKYIVWRFKPFNKFLFCGGHKQIAASEVSLFVPVLHEFVRLEVRSMEGYGSSHIDLYPQNGVVRLQLMNEESEQVVLSGPLPEIKIGKSRDQDAIFESHYELSRNAPLKRRPIPVALRLVGRAGNDGGAHNAPPCSPSRMEPIAQ